jgi:hypothetical protein
VDEAKIILRDLAQSAPMVARGFQQPIAADHIGFDEGGGAVDGAVDVAFGSQMKHRIGAILREYPAQGRGIADIGLLEAIPVVAGNRHQ